MPGFRKSGHLYGMYVKQHCVVCVHLFSATIVMYVSLHYTGDSRSVNYEDKMLCDDNNVVDDVILHHHDNVTMVTATVDDIGNTNDTKKK